MRTTHKRENYIPPNSTKVKDLKSDAIVYVGTMQTGLLFAMAFAGKSQKPAWHFSFKTEVDRERRIRTFFTSRQSIIEAKAQRKADRLAAGRSLNVGDVLSCTWGYDQTNVDFYQVTRMVGKTMVEIRTIAGEIDTTGYALDQGQTTPKPDQFIGEPMRKKADGDTVRISSYSWARKIEPEIEGVQMYRGHRFSTYG